MALLVLRGQPLLHVSQDLRLEAGADFLQRVNEAGHCRDNDVRRFTPSSRWTTRA